MALEQASPSALAHFDAADLLDALATGIVMLDAQLCPVYANVAAQDLLAFSLKHGARPPVHRFPARRGRPEPHPAACARDGRAHRRSRGGAASRPVRRARCARLMSRSRRFKAGSPVRSCCSSSPTPPNGSGSRARTICSRASTAAASWFGSSRTRSKTPSGACAARRSCSSASCRPQR